MDEDRIASVKMESNGIVLHGFLECPTNARGIVLFAHGSGSGRLSPRNQHVAASLNREGFGTLLLDLLTEEEEALDHTFQVGFLARRLLLATDWIRHHPAGRDHGLAYFGASTGAAAALVAAAIQPELIQAVVSRGGRPDLAAAYLDEVRSPTLLIVGAEDEAVITMNREAMRHINQTRCKLEIVPGATHLFEEEGALDQVAELAAAWLHTYLHPRHENVSQNV